MSKEILSSRTGTPYPWFLDVSSGAIDAKSPEARSFVRHDLVMRGASLSGVVLHYMVKNRGDNPRQDVRVHDLFGGVAQALGVNDRERVKELRLAVRELEANADENSVSGLTEFSFTRLDCRPDLVGFVASNFVSELPVSKPVCDDDLLIAHDGMSELDKLIAGLQTHGRGGLLIDAITDGRHGRFTYDATEASDDGKARRMAAYAIVEVASSSSVNY